MVVLMSLASDPLVHAEGLNVIVTPENISSQPFTFRITSEAIDDGAVRFEVYVRSGPDSIAEHHDGQLQVPPQEATKRVSDRVRVIQSPTFWCALRELPHSGTIGYSFIIPKELLSQVEFQFNDMPGVETCNTFTFKLKEFQPSR